MSSANSVPSPTVSALRLRKWFVPSSSKEEEKGRKWGLRSQALIWGMVLGVAPLTVAGVTASHVSAVARRQFQELTLSTTESQALELTQQIQVLLNSRLRDLSALSKLPLLANLKLWYGLGENERARSLSHYLDHYSDYESVTFFDLEGTVVFTTQETPLQNQSPNLLIQKALQAKQPFYFISSSHSKEALFHFAAPVRNADTNQPLGVVLAHLPSSQLYLSLQRTLPTVEQFFLLDEEGRYLVTSPEHQNLLGESINTSFPNLLEQLQAASQSAQRRRRSGQPPVFLAHGTVQAADASTPRLWGLVQRTERIPNVVSWMRHPLGLALAVAMTAGAIVLPLLLLRWASKRSRFLNAVNQSVSQWGGGDFSATLPQSPGEDEFVRLSQGLNRTAERLDSFFSQQQAQATSQAERYLAIARSRDLNEIRALLTPTLEEFRQALMVDRMVIYRFSADMNGYVLGESVASPWPSVVDLGIQDNCIPPETRQAYAAGRMFVNDNIFHTEAGLDPKHIWLLGSLEIKANLVVPILQDGELMGLLIANHCVEPHPWSEAEKELMHHFAQQLALPLHSYFAYEQRKLLALQEQQQNQRMQSSLTQLLNQVKDVSVGNLTVRAEVVEGDVGLAADVFNSIVQDLREVVAQVKQAADEVNTQVLQNDTSIRELTANASIQSEKLTQALNSVETMAGSLQFVSDKAQEAAFASQQAAHNAQASERTMEATVSSILEVRDTAAETIQKAKHLGGTSRKISKVVELINQIALKTNLLAVNAGLEAARTGEEGRGFSVLSEEVGHLVSQSADAIHETSVIVESIQEGTVEVVRAIENLTNQVVQGTRFVQDTKENLNQILTVSQQVKQAFQDISSETLSQAQDSALVKQLMSQATSIARQTSTSSQSVGVSLQQTLHITQQLQKSVASFTLEQSQ